MKIQINDKLIMKKQHPCGAKELLVLRAGMDFRLRCTGCGREFMMPRIKLEKYIKQIISQDQDGEQHV
ncbi:MAG: DUF951 domain-containing protein [Oscillospiraceae bacterium]|nr:DUF951 domain-containing protein [Oscillospiraceae bacterium]